MPHGAQNSSSEWKINIFYCILLFIQICSWHIFLWYKVRSFCISSMFIFQIYADNEWGRIQSQTQIFWLEKSLIYAIVRSQYVCFLCLQRYFYSPIINRNYFPQEWMKLSGTEHSLIRNSSRGYLLLHASSCNSRDKSAQNS